MEAQPDYIICHYGEIALKGKNRKFFEEKLVENIKKALPRGSFKIVKRISGRILVALSEGVNEKEVERALKTVFGLAYFTFAVQARQDIEAIKEKAVEILQSRNFETFRVDAKRSNKNFPLTSQQINEQVGARILAGNFAGSLAPCKQGAKLPVEPRVDLENPEVILFIEIVEKYAFLYTRKIAGLGGLPVGVSGRAACLLSGGIDSPVAAFLAMKRGLEVVFCHFHAVPYVDKVSIDKVKRLVGILGKYQGRAKLYLIPFGDIQKDVLLKTKADLRVVLYRRLMFHLAGAVAKKEKAQALITGENLGQVASQTLENMGVIEEAAEFLILRPLVCYDKEEIIQKAKEIGTYEISILPHDDCCARFLPAHPETRADLREVKREEEKLDVEGLVKEGIRNAKIEEIT